MIYSHASRYLSNQAPVPGEKLSDLLTRFSKLLGITSLSSDSSPNILITGDSSGYSASILLQSVLVRSSISAGLFFNADDSVWSNDIRKMIRLPNGYLSKDSFCSYVDQFRAIVESEESVAGYTLPASVRRVLFAGFVLVREHCSVFILDDSGATRSFPDFLPSSDLFFPSFSLLTGITSSEQRPSPAFLPRAIRKGTKEVVSNLLSQTVYQHVSGLCAAAGCRLLLPAKTQYERLSLTCQGIRFNYRGAGTYRIGTLSASELQNALAVLELIGALRRHSFSVSQEIVSECLSASPSCFSLLSLHPTVYSAYVRTVCDADILIKTLESIISAELLEPSVIICTDLPPEIFLRFHTPRMQIDITSFPVYPDNTTLARQKKLDASFVRSLVAEPNRSFVFVGDFRFLDRVEQSFHF